jgi:hypothetical protein
LVDIKNLYCGASEDIPFVSINDLKNGDVKETNYYSETPFLCFSDVGGALLKGLEKSHIEIEKAKVDLDRKEPMSLFIVTFKTSRTEIKFTTGRYVQPSRNKRPPRSENKDVFPWGYFVKIDISGVDEDVFQILSQFLIFLKREPWEGLMMDEFSSETGIWEDDVKKTWLDALNPILTEFEKKIDEAKKIKLDIKEVESYLKDAKKALEEKKLTYLIHLINKMDFGKIDAKLKEERDRGKEISNKVLELQTIIKEAKELGLDTVTVEHYLKTAKKHMFEKNWEKAFDSLKMAADIVNALKDKSRPQVKITLQYPDRFLVGGVNKVVLELENHGNVPAVDLDLEVSGEIGVGGLKFPASLDRDQKVDLPVTMTSNLGGLKNINLDLKYFREYDKKEYKVQKKLELFFVDKELKLDVKSNVEFHSGYIMIFLEITNEYIAEIQNVELEADVKEELVQLSSVDPRSNIIEKRIQLGSIPKKSSSVVVVFFDPLIKKDIPMRFEINFVDPKGKKKFLIHPIESVIPLDITCVVGEVPSSKTLIDRLATTHVHYLGKIFDIPTTLTPTECYDALRKTSYSLPGSQVWESNLEVVKKTRGRRRSSTAGTERVLESWYMVQDRDPGYSAGLHIRVNEGSDSVEISVAANDRMYSYSLLLKVQEDFQKELIERKYLPKNTILHQCHNHWLRQRIRGRQTVFLKMGEVEDVNLEKKIKKASKEREKRFASIRELELKSLKYKAWSGKK